MQIEKTKIHQHQNVTNHISTPTKTKKDILITPTQPTTTPTMHPISYNKPTNSEKLRNEPFGHTLLTKTTDSVRILFQNVNDLEISSTGHTLEETCNVITKFNIDIACLAEINTNWDHPKAKKQIHKIKQRFWKRSKLTTAMSSVPWNKVYTPGEVAILSTPSYHPE